MTAEVYALARENAAAGVDFGHCEWFVRPDRVVPWRYPPPPCPEVASVRVRGVYVGRAVALCLDCALRLGSGVALTVADEKPPPRS